MRLLMSSDKLCPSFDPCCCCCSFKRENCFIYLIIHAKDEEFYMWRRKISVTLVLTQFQRWPSMLLLFDIILRSKQLHSSISWKGLRVYIHYVSRNGCAPKTLNGRRPLVYLRLKSFVLTLPKCYNVIWLEKVWSPLRCQWTTTFSFSWTIFTYYISIFILDAQNVSKSFTCCAPDVDQQNKTY